MILTCIKSLVLCFPTTSSSSWCFLGLCKHWTSERFNRNLNYAFEMSKQLLKLHSRNIASVRAANRGRREKHSWYDRNSNRKMPLRPDNFVRDHNTQSTHRIDSNWTIMSITARGLLWIFLHLVFFARAFHQFYNLSIFSHESAQSKNSTQKA